MAYMRSWRGWMMVAAAAGLLWAWPGMAQDTADQPEEAGTMEQLLEQREAPPVVEPVQEGRVDSVPSRVGRPATQVDLDPAVLGLAPDQTQPPLRREGEFVVNRRGRLVRSADGMHVLFAFEADGKESPEPPMILQPCRYLETMESMVQQRGDEVIFVLSGQVFTYRGANYLLPTMMKIAEDRGNLQP